MQKGLLVFVSLFLSIQLSANAITKRQKVEKILKTKCMDCHSNETVYPWYYNFPIAKQLMDADIQKGRAFFDLKTEIFNLENEKDISKSTLSRLAHEIETDSMPLLQYKLAHWNTIITAEDKKIILSWIKDLKAGKFSEPIEPLPMLADLKLDNNKVTLGKLLYHDKRLSGDNTLSCASCHDLAKGGTDQKQFSIGIRGQLGHINSPTSYNSAFNIKQFWDGRAEDLEGQAHGPVHNPIEMGSSWKDVIKKLSADAQMVAMFKKAYGIKSANEITGDMIANSIGEFEKSLVTNDNRFDKYLRGDKNALTADELKGYELFKKYDCTSCHNGPAVGGASFQKMGVVQDYFNDRAAGLHGLNKMAISKEDYGRFNVTKKEEDKFKLKIPILRNIKDTYPYMHDGNVATLEEAVRIMGQCQVGTKIPKQDIDLIVKFLRTL